MFQNRRSPQYSRKNRFFLYFNSLWLASVFSLFGSFGGPARKAFFYEAHRRRKNEMLIARHWPLSGADGFHLDKHVLALAYPRFDGPWGSKSAALFGYIREACLLYQFLKAFNSHKAVFRRRFYLSSAAYCRNGN